MNTTTLKGDGQALGGQIKETVGDVTGNSSLQGEGVVDQITGNANKAVGAARDAVGPLTEKATTFAKTRPYATAALLGVVGLAVLNTLRGK